MWIGLFVGLVCAAFVVGQDIWLRRSVRPPPGFFTVRRPAWQINLALGTTVMFCALLGLWVRILTMPEGDPELRALQIFVLCSFAVSLPLNVFQLRGLHRFAVFPTSGGLMVASEWGTTGFWPFEAIGNIGSGAWSGSMMFTAYDMAGHPIFRVETTSPDYPSLVGYLMWGRPDLPWSTIRGVYVPRPAPALR